MCCYIGSDSTDGKCCLSGRPDVVFPPFLCLFCSILCKSYLPFIYVPSRRLWHLSKASHFRRLWSVGNKCIWWSLRNSSNFVLYAILGNLLSNILHHSFFTVYFPNSESKQCKGKVEAFNNIWSNEILFHQCAAVPLCLQPDYHHYSHPTLPLHGSAGFHWWHTQRCQDTREVVSWEVRLHWQQSPDYACSNSNECLLFTCWFCPWLQLDARCCLSLIQKLFLTNTSNIKPKVMECGRQWSKVKMLLLYRCTLCKFHVIDSKNRYVFQTRSVSTTQLISHLGCIHLQHTRMVIAVAHWNFLNWF